MLVTLNPRPGRPDPASIVGKYEYDHPVYTSSSVASQRALAQFQGRDGLHFAGAWLAYGFHEDGFSSGLRAAVALGAQPPFEPRPAERVLPPRSSLLLLFLDLLELTRRASRPFTNLALLIAIWYSVILETVTNLLVTILGGPHAPCGIAADIRTVRASWERARGNESGNYWTKLERNSPPRGTVRSAAQMANEHSKAE